MAKSDVTQLEKLVAQGRLGEALSGYERLLSARPDDGVLRTRVMMLREAVKSSDAQNSGAWARVEDAPVAPVRLPFNVTQEDVADGYVTAGRYQDALVLLEQLRQTRPQDKTLQVRWERVRKLLDAEQPARQSDAALFEAVKSDARIAAPRAATRPSAGGPAPTAPPPAPARAPAGAAASGPPVAFVRVPPPEPTTSPARPAASTFGTPKSNPAARSMRALQSKPTRPETPAARAGTQPTTPVVTDESIMLTHAGAEERTMLSAPPEVSAPRAPVESTMVAAPSAYQLAVTRGALPEPAHRMQRSDTRPDLPVDRNTSNTDPQGEDAAAEHSKTLMAPPPTGFHRAVQDLPQDKRPVVSHEERTAFGPPPDMDPPPARKKKR